MNSSLPAFGVLCTALLVGCAGGPKSASEATETPIASGRSVLPDALMRSAYEAPEWPAGAPAEFGATETTVATVPAPGAPSAVVASTAPTPSAYMVRPEDQVVPPPRQASAPAVPPAPQIAQNPYQPRADLSALDPIVTTNSREPKVEVASAPPPAPAPVPTPPPASAETMAILAEAEASLPSAPTPLVPPDVINDRPFQGETQSIMSTPAPVPAAPPPAPRRTMEGGFGLHLASYRKESNAVNGWGIYQDRHPDVLAGLTARGVDVTIPGKGRYIRLLVGPFSTPEDARALCGALAAREQYCKVLPFAGDVIS